MKNNKTVFVLGAGFSVEAGAPTQANILKETFRLFAKDASNFDKSKFNTFKKFLTKQLNIKANKCHEVELEDIFTPLDRCLSESSQFRGIGLDEIMKVRESVFYVVGKTIQLKLNEAAHSEKHSKEYINKFAHYLTEKSSIRKNQQYRNHDPVSVISTNWDILLDNSIYKNIEDSFREQAVVDYCCYISSSDEHDHSIKPGLEKLGLGGFNVKLLKLHGSLNWLQCPRCMRLYARFFNKIGIQTTTEPKSCRHCDKNFSEEQGKHLLASNLIMPTFIKDLSNPQYKIIWQNAGIEISEATKIIFIGYSLPNADFEMRQLLSRMTRKEAAIEVVDFCDKTDIQDKTRNHWLKFFGNRKVEFHFNGAKSYIDDLTSKRV